MRPLAGIESVHVLSGAVLWVIAIATWAEPGRTAPGARAHRAGTGLFWALLGTAFALGGVLPAWLTGLLVVGMVACDGLGLIRPGRHAESTPEAKAAAADRFGNRIFLPVLAIPVLTYLAPLVLPGDAGQAVFVGLGYSSLLAAGVALALTRARPRALVDEGRRLADAMGAVVILPQLLASLGTLFKVAGVGTVIARGVSAVIPQGSALAAVLAACLGVVAFTLVMGNSFASFPVMVSGIGVPLLIRPLHAEPALVGLMLLTCASCGTLCTPMAANFNVVPAALFEMRDRRQVLRVQAPYALAMFAVHVLLLWVLVR